MPIRQKNFLTAKAVKWRNWYSVIRYRLQNLDLRSKLKKGSLKQSLHLRFVSYRQLFRVFCSKGSHIFIIAAQFLALSTSDIIRELSIVYKRILDQSNLWKMRWKAFSFSWPLWTPHDKKPFLCHFMKLSAKYSLRYLPLVLLWISLCYDCNWHSRRKTKTATYYAANIIRLFTSPAPLTVLSCIYILSDDGPKSQTNDAIN